MTDGITEMFRAMERSRRETERKNTYFVSGHLSLTNDEFQKHYVPMFDEALSNKSARFIVGDAPGADFMSQKYLHERGAKVIVAHMMSTPRNLCEGIRETVGGFASDETRDAWMTHNSGADIAWVRPGREGSGTAKNLARRKNE